MKWPAVECRVSYEGCAKPDYTRLDYTIEYLIEYSCTRLIPEVAIDYRVVQKKRTPVCRPSLWRNRQSVSGTLDRPRVVAPSKTCGQVRSSRRRRRWAQCRPRSAAPTFGRVVLAGASTPAWCPVYRLHECPSQPGVVRSWMVSLPVVAARDQKWRVDSDKSGLLSLLRQFVCYYYTNSSGPILPPCLVNIIIIIVTKILIATMC